MEGKALVWFQDIEAAGGISSWEGFVCALQTKFGSSPYEDPMEALIRLKQTSTMEDYKSQFDALSNQLKGLVESYELSCFLSGLREDIQFVVRMLNPSNLHIAFGLGKMQEENVPALRRIAKLGSVPTCLAIGPLSPPEKRAIVLCDESSDDEVPKSEVVEGSASKSKEETPIVELEPEISIHALFGSPNPKTMRFLGHICGRVVVILVDTGSTHNFMDPFVIQRAYQPFNPTEGLSVKVANEQAVHSEGNCAEVPLHMQGNLYTTDFSILTLRGCDIVLGIQWLRTLGPILWDFSRLQMEFSVLDKPRRLQGMSPTGILLVEGENFGTRRNIAQEVEEEKKSYGDQSVGEMEGLGEEEASWVEYSTLVNEFPDLVNKVAFERKDRFLVVKTATVRQLTGSLTRSEGLRFAVCGCGAINEIVTKPLLKGALEINSVFSFMVFTMKNLQVIWVLGSFEIGVVAESLGKS
ncbi:hypothetical protein Patl1_27117 [Pistacia atlantica]|uniref:Uncharacterized protein n=1 Tax=Pistacia atlantica TaxID=434234 RepID=A0ACC1B4S0_9ROSI|nr:hypothetical protein Patl1_27117 [Pistacia atlantica]